MILLEYFAEELVLGMRYSFDDKAVVSRKVEERTGLARRSKFR